MRDFLSNDRGYIYTLESIIGIFLILGAVVYVSSNMPYASQKTGEFSKVQLVNIGRDSLDLIAHTPADEIFNNYSKNQGVNRTYTLLANNQTSISVFIGENINFTVYLLDNSSLFSGTLVLEKSKLGVSLDSGSQTNWTIIQGFVIKNITIPGEYSIMAVDSFTNPTKYSNAVTISVGNYFLETNVSGIFANGDLNVNGTVYYPNWTGAPNLSLQILDNSGTNVVVNNVATTNNTGNFSFIWPAALKSSIYYINATDSKGNYSNSHMIVYSGTNPPEGNVCCDAVIYETKSISITVFNVSGTFKMDDFYINGVLYDSAFDKTKIVLSNPIKNANSETVTFTAFTAGDYYICYKCKNGNPSVKADSIMIRVLPLLYSCQFGQCDAICPGLNIQDLNNYIKTFILPPYMGINYNLYLIDPNGRPCTVCADFSKPVINGYPTDKAVTVNKIIRFKTPLGDRFEELRMILWYK